MQQARGQAQAVAAAQVEVDLLGAHRVGGPGAEHQQRGGIVGDDVAQREPAGADLGEIEIEPVRQRGVHVGDVAARVGRKEAGRRVVEEIDGVLEFLKDVLVAFALARHVRDGPQGELASALAGLADQPAGVVALQRPHADPVPGHVGVAEQGGGDAQFLGAALALARRRRQPVKRLRHLRRPGKQPVDRARAAVAAARRRPAGQRHIGVVGVEDRGFALGHQQAVGTGVRQQPGDVVAGARGVGAEKAGGEADQSQRADGGQAQQQDKQEHRGLFVGQPGKARHDRDAGARERQDQHRLARAFAPLCGDVHGTWAHAGPVVRWWGEADAYRKKRRNRDAVTGVYKDS